MDDLTPEFVSLWTRYQLEVRRYVCMLVPGVPDIEDVMQQTASRLWEKFEQYDSQRPFVPWAIGFAYHEIMSWRQRQARDRLVFSEEILAQLHATIGEEASLLELRRSALDSCLQKLTADEQSLLLVATRYTGPSSGKQSSRRSARTSCTTPSRSCELGCWRVLTERCGWRVGGMGETQNPSGLDQLIARLVDCDATVDDIATLEKLLDCNPEAQRRYVHYLDLHQELLARGGSGIPANPQDQSHGEFQDDNDRSSIPRTRVAVLVAMAAGLLLALGLVIGRWTKPTPGHSDYAQQGEDIPRPVQNEEADDGVAVLTHAVGVEWLGDDPPPHTGTILSPGELKLARGLIQVEFYNGVQLLVEGPADLEIQSVASVICREGRLRSLVPPNATGFSVLTPKFELVDLGTEFAVDVASDGRADAHVFDGEVELYLPDGKREPDHKQVLLGGDAIVWSPKGTKTPRAAAPEAFTSFETIRSRERSATDQRFENWQQWKKTLHDDPRIVTRYEFEADSATLIDSSLTKAHGTIVGCQWASGRWPEKRALEFKRPGDRVRIDIPGEFEALTMSAWVRVDALPPRRQALLLTDGYQVGRLHWQIGPDGELRIGSRVPIQNRQRQPSYASPEVFTPRQVGVWNFVCSTYDRNAKTVAHWFNGKCVFTKPLEMDQPLRIGIAEIGNWGVPLKPERRAIRNFIGRMDELTTWSVALTGDEIADIYNKSRP